MAQILTASNALEFSWKNDSAEEAASRGQLFYVQLEGDGGGPLEVFVNETVPEKILETVRTINRRYKLKLETGKATVGGVEDFGAKKRAIAEDFNIEPGTYAVRCHLPDEKYLNRGEREPVLLKGPWMYRFLYRLTNWFVAAAILGFLLSIGTLCVVDDPGNSLFAFVSAMVMVVGIVGLIGLRFVPGVRRVGMQDVAKRTEGEAPMIFELTASNDDADLMGGFVLM